jgi:hypothetical protein
MILKLSSVAKILIVDGLKPLSILLIADYYTLPETRSLAPAKVFSKKQLNFF